MPDHSHGRLEELVYLTLGRASMCWSEIPKGVYDDECAHRLGEELLRAIYQHEQETTQREKSAWLLSHPLYIRDGQGNIIAQSKGLSGEGK
jgi:hypothetical protein